MTVPFDTLELAVAHLRELRWKLDGSKWVSPTGEATASIRHRPFGEGVAIILRVATP